MSETLSSNTTAILLLTAPLITGRNAKRGELATPGEYKRLAALLREAGAQPADLLGPDAERARALCRGVIDEERLASLLARGFQLSQAVERWQARAIWVVSRADAAYPKVLKSRLRDDSPPILYGCGARGLLEGGGLAVVGSRHVDDALLEYAHDVGRRVAAAERSVISGAARGVDRAAMSGALEAGGRAVGVLADGLESAALNRENRAALLEGRLALISPYDPSAAFNVGHAMQRNKLIYALSDAALIVNAEVEKGGTWAGAIEQLDRLHLVPIYVRAKGQPSAGLEALLRRGALRWPEPNDPDEIATCLSAPVPAPTICPTQPELFASTAASAPSPSGTGAVPDEPPLPRSPTEAPREQTPEDALLETVRAQILRVARASFGTVRCADVASRLGVGRSQAEAWLLRLVAEGILEKRAKPARFTLREPSGARGAGEARANAVAEAHPKSGA